MKGDPIMLRVEKGRLVPADRAAEDALRERAYKVGDVVACEIEKIRNPKFHRKAHVLGRLLVENLESFGTLTSHQALKRLQWEGNIACEEMMMNVPGMGAVSIRIPKSLSFAKMDEAEFGRVYKLFCDQIRQKYYPELAEDEVEEMARLAGDAG